MKHLYCVIALFIFGCLVFNPLVFADGINGLEEIYNTSIPSEIRRNFNEYNRIYQACLGDNLGVLDGEKLGDIYSKKFLVIGLQSNGFGGFWATIAVKDEKLRVFRLWLYDIDYNVYDLRSITELFGYLDEEAMRQLTSAAYSRFWI